MNDEEKVERTGKKSGMPFSASAALTSSHLAPDWHTMSPSASVAMFRGCYKERHEELLDRLFARFCPSQTYRCIFLPEVFLSINGYAQLMYPTRKKKDIHTPAKCPSSDVPPENGVIGTFHFLAISTTFTTSSVLCACTTTLCG